MGKLKRICLDVTNIVPGQGGAGGGISTYAKYLVLGMDEIIGTGKFPLDIIVVGHPEFLKSLHLKSLPVFEKTVNNQSFLSRFVWLNIKLPIFLKNQNIDMVHRVVPELPIFNPVRGVMTLHDFMFDFYLGNEQLMQYLSVKARIKFRFLRKLMRMNCKSKNLILVPSKSIYDEAKKRFPNRDLNVHVTRLATSPEFVHPANSKKKEDSDFINLGYISGFYPHKGHKKAIEFMHAVSKDERGAKVRLYFRGSKVFEDYFNEIRAMVKNSDLEGAVFFEEFEKNITIGEIYDKYNATLLLSEYEGFGLPVLESQTFNKPVICTDIPIFKENLKDSAFFVEREMTKESATRILDLLWDKNAQNELIKKGKKNSSQYSWEATCQNTIASYLSFFNA